MQSTLSDNLREATGVLVSQPFILLCLTDQGHTNGSLSLSLDTISLYKHSTAAKTVMSVPMLNIRFLAYLFMSLTPLQGCRGNAQKCWESCATPWVSEEWNDSINNSFLKQINVNFGSREAIKNQKSDASTQPALKMPTCPHTTWGIMLQLLLLLKSIKYRSGCQITIIIW